MSFEYLTTEHCHQLNIYLQSTWKYTKIDPWPLTYIWTDFKDMNLGLLSRFLPNYTTIGHSCLQLFHVNSDAYSLALATQARQKLPHHDQAGAKIIHNARKKGNFYLEKGAIFGCWIFFWGGLVPPPPPPPPITSPLGSIVIMVGNFQIWPSWNLIYAKIADSTMVSFRPCLLQTSMLNPTTSTAQSSAMQSFPFRDKFVRGFTKIVNIFNFEFYSDLRCP